MARGRACAQWWPCSSQADTSLVPRRTRASRPKVQTTSSCVEPYYYGLSVCDFANEPLANFEARQRSCGFQIITATIDGTDIEKRYFHEFKNVAAQDNIYEPDC
ncbi:hypothetical protein CFAM422_006880 [Trichoderma lentiforme]|uniref:Uncharacterized protein n=1 Tax=Trichoderma lentiforme TaxID=1567552 RepID=A0A9P5CDY1_9HYPO|nr:hypothetical protein CFAM422_006880 [Trichoderma lentiforme]